MTGEKIIEILNQIGARISKEKQLLTELDNVIGDGDHGINLNRGFEAVSAKLTNVDADDPAFVLKTTGMTLVSTVGGASGPLYGTLFMYMGKALDGKPEIALSDFLTALRVGIEGVAMRGKSHPGEKTMLDAMTPALEAMEKALAQEKDTAEILAEGTAAAWAGVEYTQTIAATKGRASYLGERSIGHQDPGATSFSMMLEELYKAVE